MNKKIKIIYRILIITIILMLLEQISYAKYVKMDILKSKQTIAQPIFNLKEGKPIKIDKINKNGYYEFSIENFIEDKVSEVGFLYTIEIALNVEVVPIEPKFNFRLYNEEGEIELTNLKTNPIYIKGNEKDEQKYKVNIEYNDDKGDEIDRIFGEIQIKVNAEQEIK